MTEGLENRNPSLVKRFEFNRQYYLGNATGYRIGDLTPNEMQQVETGDFSPVKKRLDALATDLRSRDKLVIKLMEDIGACERIVDIALAAAADESDLGEDEERDSDEDLVGRQSTDYQVDTAAVAALSEISQQLSGLQNLVETYHHGD